MRVSVVLVVRAGLFENPTRREYDKAKLVLKLTKVVVVVSHVQRIGCQAEKT